MVCSRLGITEGAVYIAEIRFCMRIKKSLDLWVVAESQEFENCFCHGKYVNCQCFVLYCPASQGDYMGAS